MIVQIKKELATKVLSKLTFEAIGRKVSHKEIERAMFLVNGVYQGGLPIFMGVSLMKVKVLPHKAFKDNTRKAEGYQWKDDEDITIQYKENELTGMEYLIDISSLEEVKE